ncbi:hypothetical protein ACHAWF_003172 [Thalassiosira exigua]
MASPSRYIRLHRAIFCSTLTLILVIQVVYLLTSDNCGVSIFSTTVESTNQWGSCQLTKNSTLSSSDYELYRAVHLSDFPACAAGSWTMRPDLAVIPSAEHLQCLDEELEGNCHDLEASKNANDVTKQKLNRYNSMVSNKLQNSPGIMNSSDPWVWQSDLEEYRTVPFYKTNQDEYKERIRKLFENRTMYFIGDSLTRQWQHSIKCELVHVLGIPIERADDMVVYIWMAKRGIEKGILRKHGSPFTTTATERDYVVFNFGHHMGPKLGPNWRSSYRKFLEDAAKISFGNIPRSHVFFRTTSVRHFIRGKGDWNTDSFQAGAAEPTMQAAWRDFGGNAPELPEQNLIAFETFLGGGDTKHSGFRILDTSPMTLARADATFEGVHFCLPGPMDFWSRMLYYQILGDERRTERTSQN